ncbi:unnamed protein product, partial [Mesorhabditis spiculigera]
MVEPLDDLFSHGREFIGDEEVFEINDFTVVTQLEQFTVVSWESKEEEIKFGSDNILKMKHVWPVYEEGLEVASTETKASDNAYLSAQAKSLMSFDLDFYPKDNIVAMFGVTEYIVIQPGRDKLDRIVTEDQKNMIISGIQTAASSCFCELPIFVQYGKQHLAMYFGALCTKSTMTNFEAYDARYGRLDGLAELFREKVSCPVPSLEAEDLRVSVQLQVAYTPYSDDDLTPKNQLFFDISDVPFGSSETVIENFTLLATWPNQKEGLIHESQNYSDLDPVHAFAWAGMTDFVNGGGYLSDCLEALLKVAHSPMSERNAYELLALDSFLDKEARRVMEYNNRKAEEHGHDFPLKEEVISTWLKRILPFEDEDYRSETEIKDPLSAVKAAPPESNAARLGDIFLQALAERIYPATAFADLWQKFVNELTRYQDSTSSLLSRSLTEHPDFSSCLLHQKLQMLWCCFAAKRKRAEMVKNLRVALDDDDEFFDASSELGTSPSKVSHRNDKTDGDSSAARGRRHVLAGDFSLRDFPDRAIYEPFTQERLPMAEDDFEAHEQYLSQLEEGEQRTEAQMEMLLSDMQAFKAANPGCCFEDFLQWHSPKDIVSDKEELPEASERMSTPGNAWLLAWEKAEPLACALQDPIFDYEKISEQILYWLATRTCAEFCSLLHPIGFTEAARKLCREADGVEGLIDTSTLIDATARACKSNTRDDYLDALREIRRVEKEVLRYQAVYNMLESGLAPAADEADLKQFVLDLLKNEKLRDEENSGSLDPCLFQSGVPIIGGPNGALGQAIKDVILSKENADRVSTIRNYVFHWLVPRPDEGSRLCPQRMYASTSRDEFRLSGSFTRDIIFS